MKFIKLFENVSMENIACVGGKNASLGEMIQHLTPQGIPIPSGFIITAQAYQHHIELNNLSKKISELLNKLNIKNVEELAQVGEKIRFLIATAPLPKDLEQEIEQAYQDMKQQHESKFSVAVRSSATAEDLPQASFAGQQETFLNIFGKEQLLTVCPKAFASLFTNRAISYRIHHGFKHMDVALSIGVQKMIRSDEASSGVMFTLDTESGFKDVVFINSSYGLGENIVQGAVNPDEFHVHKPTFKKGFKPLLKKRLGSKKIKMVYSAEEADQSIKNIIVPEEEQKRFSITDDEVLELSKYAIIIEDYYSKKRGSWCPMDIEWAKDGKQGKIYILQARPETVHSQKQQQDFFEEYILDKKNLSSKKILVEGKSVGKKIASGKTQVIQSINGISQLQEGEILVTDMTDPDWEPIMKKAGGIITNRGGRTCHAAIVSRELGIAAIVGTEEATKKISTGQHVTMDCSGGEVGMVYEGALDFEIKKIIVKTEKKPPVPIMMNIGNPDNAFASARIPNNGVGLARLEFIINNTVKIHPMALVQFDKVDDESSRSIIQNLTANYEDKTQFFIDTLAQEAGTIAAAFYPKPVIIRMSDFKSNEYRQLVGGANFEPKEENPMLGFRGASRYYHEKYRDAFALECLAMKKIREDMGLDNVILMIPFVRTTDEAQAVLNEMKKFGLERRKKSLQIYMMCEIPSNVILIDQFAKWFDGFSIGSNDLTQMTLAIDRDSELVAPIFDERNEAVKIMLQMAIEGAHRNNIKIGICGQAPSDFPEIANFLIENKIDSMSLNPDSVLKELVFLEK
jgi:pyruvate, water dikinase